MDVNPLVGTVVEERYCIESELGAGAMGVVYRGRHIKVGRPVAIKVLHDHLVQDTSMVARFEREARIAAKLRHTNLVAVIDIGYTPDGKMCMVLELAPGRCLAELVCRAMPPQRVIDMTRQLLHGLEHAHGLGLVHRDLKPENVLVEQHADGHVTPRIVDFGIAVLRDQDDVLEGRRLTTAGLVLGTPMYMSPEQARGDAVDPRTDLFALGVIVYEMLAGKPPFEGSGLEVMMLNMMQDPPSIATRTGLDVDPLLEGFARKLMSREASDRFASARAALDVLALIEHDRDAAAKTLGLATAVPESLPEVARAHDAVVTARNPKRANVVSLAMAPLAKMEMRTSESDPVGSEPPRRRRWGTLVGAAAIICVALLIVVWLANAARAHAETRGNSPIQQTNGCSHQHRDASSASTVSTPNGR